MMKKFSSLLIVDLILVSLWAVFFFWNIKLIFFSVPIVVLRLAISFTLSHKQKNGIWLAVAFALAGVFLSVYMTELVIRPIAKMYDCMICLIQGQSSMLTGAYHFLGNHGNHVPVPGLSWSVWMVCWLCWIFLMPAVMGVVIFAKGKSSPNKWLWKKILFVCLYYAVFIFLLSLYGDSEIVASLKYCIWGFGILLIPVLFRIRMKKIPEDVYRYGILVAIFTLALGAGFMMNSLFSLVAILISIPAFWCFIGDGEQVFSLRKNISWRGVYLAAIGGFLFWMAQYSTIGIKVWLWIISISFIGYAASSYYKHTHSWTKSLIMFLVCSFILPIISIGYNPYSCIDGQRLCNYNDYAYSHRGLLLIADDVKVGIRDRFGIVVPCGYDNIQTLGDRSKPYVGVCVNGKWGIYDLEQQKEVVKPEYKFISKHGDNAWRLVGVESDRYFFISPSYYRFDTSNSTVSENPINN